MKFNERRRKKTNERPNNNVSADKDSFASFFIHRKSFNQCLKTFPNENEMIQVNAQIGETGIMRAASQRQLR